MKKMKGEKKLANQKVSNPLGRGIWSGIVAGLALAMFMMFVVAPVLGKPVMAPVNMIGAAFLGKAVLMHPNMGSILLGMMVHLIDSAILGIIFAYIMRGIKGGRGAAVIYGVIYGLLVWLIMAYEVLPVLHSPMAKVTGTWFFWAHLIFGIVLGLLSPVYLRNSGK